MSVSLKGRRLKLSAIHASFSISLRTPCFATCKVVIQFVLIVSGPRPSSKNPHFQNEASCTTFHVKMSFICMRMKNDFHIKGWRPTLVWKQRPGGTRKWPIAAKFGLKVDLWIIACKFLKFIVIVLSFMVNSLGVLLSSFSKSIYNKVQIERALW